jgi:hypothetical protein
MCGCMDLQDGSFAAGAVLCGLRHGLAGRQIGFLVIVCRVGRVWYRQQSHPDSNGLHLLCCSQRQHAQCVSTLDGCHQC